MPRLKVDPYFSELVISLYKNFLLTQDGSPTSRIIHAQLIDTLGYQGPSERWVSGKIAEYLELRKNVFEEPKINPLETGWPRDPKQIAYLAALTRSRGLLAFQMTSLTASEIEVAIELKDILEWDLPWGKKDLPKRLDWRMPAADGGATEYGELAVIKEIASRRALEKFSGVKVRYSDIYTLINFQPWRRWVTPEGVTGTRWNELKMAYNKVGICNVQHLVRGFFVPPLMRMEISGTESVMSVVQFLTETLVVTEGTGRLGQNLRHHFDKYYRASSREEFEASDMTLDDLATSETRDLNILQSTYYFRSEESKATVEAIDSLVTTRPDPAVIERDFGSTSIGYLNLLRRLIDDAWDDIRSIRWAPEDGPLVSGFGERPDFQSRSRPDLYFSVEVDEDLIDDLPF